MPQHLDALVIGAGQAGPSLAARLAASGRQTAIVERLRFGGTCVNVGCMPTKTLVASARAIHTARRGDEFGFSTAGEVRADMRRIKARKDAIVAQSRDGIEASLRGTPNVSVLQGHARFTAPREVVVDGQSIEADQIFINVGARAIVPDMEGARHHRCLTNSTILDLDAVPEHLVVIGGSYIGLEFAQVFRRFGSRVTVVERSDRLISREDDDVSAGLREVLEGEGIAFRLSATCIDVQPGATGVSVGVDCTHGAHRIEGSHVLFAIGRRPNTDDLGLDRAGIVTDARGYIQVDGQGRTNVEGVWALGECNGHGAFTHTSYNDYEVVAANLLDGDSRRLTDRIPCYALYTDPPVGRAGMTLQEARATGRPLLVGFRPMTRVSRAKEMSETHGFMRAIVDAETRRILGAVVFGAGGDEVVHSLLDVMYAGVPASTIARGVHIHPTITELVPTMLQELVPL
jgi:pyruvate/2-oxoglutarate dehydrogenase complex dihydrolipoamide dehydrogenase (E3) component